MTLARKIAEQIAAQISDIQAESDYYSMVQQDSRCGEEMMLEKLESILSRHLDQEWVKVSDERKPPPRSDDDWVSEDILLYVPAWEQRERNAVVVGNYLHGSKKFRPNGRSGWEDSVSHWRLLPAPPVEHS